MTETELIRKCCTQIEQQLNWGPSDRWTNQDFERLSDLILQETKIKLSVSTLKRIWGKVSYSNLPSTSTLNALALFAWQGSWRELWQQHDAAGDHQQDLPRQNEFPKTKPWWERPALRKAVFMTALILIGLIIYLIFS